MISLFFERVAFLGALSAFVLALLWVHAEKFIAQIVNKIIKTYKVILYSQKNTREDGELDINDDNDDATYQQQFNKQQKVIKDHPKFSGLNFRRRKTSEKESIRSTYRSFEGYGQSSLESNPSFSKGFPLPSNINHHQQHHPSSLPLGQHGASGQLLGGGGAVRVGERSSSSAMLSLFSASIIALIIYTTMKLFTARFGGAGSGIKKRSYYDSTTTTTRKFRDSETTKDLRADKRKFDRLSREERVRKLILHHGGRNVTTAIKFLINELEKQKQLLYEKLLLEELESSCSCSLQGCNNNNNICSCNNNVRTECCDNKNNTTTKDCMISNNLNNKHDQPSSSEKQTSGEHTPSRANDAKPSTVILQ